MLRCCCFCNLFLIIGLFFLESGDVFVVVVVEVEPLPRRIGVHRV